MEATTCRQALRAVLSGRAEVGHVAWARVRECSGARYALVQPLACTACNTGSAGADGACGCLWVCEAMHDEAMACGWGICGCLGSLGLAVEAQHGPQTHDRLYLLKFPGGCA